MSQSTQLDDELCLQLKLFLTPLLQHAVQSLPTQLLRMRLFAQLRAIDAYRQLRNFLSNIGTVFRGLCCRYRPSHQCLQALAGYEQIAQHAGIPLLELSLRWVAYRQQVGSMVLGASSVEQMTEQLQCLDAGALPEELVNAIDRVHEMQPSPCP